MSDEYICVEPVKGRDLREKAYRGELDSSELDAFNEHLLLCSSCRKKYHVFEEYLSSMTAHLSIETRAEKDQAFPSPSSRAVVFELRQKRIRAAASQRQLDKKATDRCRRMLNRFSYLLPHIQETLGRIADFHLYDLSAFSVDETPKLYPSRGFGSVTSPKPMTQLNWDLVTHHLDELVNFPYDWHFSRKVYNARHFEKFSSLVLRDGQGVPYGLININVDIKSLKKVDTAALILNDLRTTTGTSLEKSEKPGSLDDFILDLDESGQAAEQEEFLEMLDRFFFLLHKTFGSWIEFCLHDLRGSRPTSHAGTLRSIYGSVTDRCIGDHMTSAGVYMLQKNCNIEVNYRSNWREKDIKGTTVVFREEEAPFAIACINIDLPLLDSCKNSVIEEISWLTDRYDLFEAIIEQARTRAGTDFLNYLKRDKPYMFTEGYFEGTLKALSNKTGISIEMLRDGLGRPQRKTAASLSPHPVSENRVREASRVTRLEPSFAIDLSFCIKNETGLLPDVSSHFELLEEYWSKCVLGRMENDSKELRSCIERICSAIAHNNTLMRLDFPSPMVSRLCEVGLLRDEGGQIFFQNRAIERFVLARWCFGLIDHGNFTLFAQRKRAISLWRTIRESTTKANCLVGILERLHDLATSRTDEMRSILVSFLDATGMDDAADLWVPVFGRFPPSDIIDPSLWEAAAVTHLPAWYGRVILRSLVTVGCARSYWVEDWEHAVYTRWPAYKSCISWYDDEFPDELNEYVAWLAAATGRGD